MRIRGQELEINFEEEIEGIEFHHAKIRENKLQACSPFRDDTKPSFAINLENGLWIDSGASLDHMKKGNIVSFLAYIRECSFEDVEDYLLEKYSIDYTDLSKLDLKIKLDAPKKVKENETITFTAEYSYSRYLDKIRGIDTEVQKLFKTFETVKDGQRVVGMAWYNKDGELINIKYRCLDKKFFFYEETGMQIKPHLFGLHLFKQYNCRTLWIVESEIDAMYLWSCGIPSVAIGRASINDKQLKLIYKLDIDNVVIATDNDPVGRAVCNVLKEELLPHFNVSELVFPEGIKDVNDLSDNVLKYKKMTLKKITIGSII